MGSWMIVFGLVMVAGIAAAVGVILLIMWRLMPEGRQSPLTRNLLRPPGHSLGNHINDLTERLSTLCAMTVTLPIIVYAAHISQSYFGGVAESVARTLFTAILGLVAAAFLAKTMVKTAKDLRYKVLGWEAEVFTSEELNRLMLDGCQVFHDIPFPHGNIDHVVVSPDGVHSIDTKSYGKLMEGAGRQEVIVDYQRNVLVFQDRQVSIPTGQLEGEARWLADYLSKATGDSVTVEAMLAIPGWFIKDRVGRGTVCVFNPQNSRRFFVKGTSKLTPQQMSRIAHQLDQLCRDVEPTLARTPSWD
ncbi:MAG: NERD domain-containing protein [Planctomycetaceae bacterium]|nr:NERD domain-containing protein [Planctomycetaceae bacterium]